MFVLFLLWELLGSTHINFQVRHTALLTTVIMLYIVSLALFNLVTSYLITSTYLSIPSTPTLCFRDHSLISFPISSIFAFLFVFRFHVQLRAYSISLV